MLGKCSVWRHTLWYKACCAQEVHTDLLISQVGGLKDQSEIQSNPASYTHTPTRTTDSYSCYNYASADFSFIQLDLCEKTPNYKLMYLFLQYEMILWHVCFAELKSVYNCMEQRICPSSYYSEVVVVPCPWNVCRKPTKFRTSHCIYGNLVWSTPRHRLGIRKWNRSIFVGLVCERWDGIWSTWEQIGL